MKKILLIGLLLMSVNVCAQTDKIDDGLVQMGKYYRQFMFRNKVTEDALDDFKNIAAADLKFTADFIKETLLDQNSLISDRFLARPNDRDLKYIYIVELINYNVRKENPVDNKELVADLLKKDVSPYELLHTYYSMLFIGYGNKVKPYDLSSVDFKLNRYGLKDDTEKGIFFSESMEFNGSMIWGYINVVKPPRFDKAISFINLYPKYNGAPYYQYLDFSFPDFNINIESETKKQSYKAYYINKFYDLLLNNLACLNSMNVDKEKIYDLVLGSILKERNYYKYSKREDELKKLLRVYQKD